MGTSSQWVDLASVRIPSLPDVVARLQAMLADPETGLAELGSVVATDPPLAARVLRTANSAAYGLSEPVQTIQRAAAVLGIAALRNIVLQVCLVEAFVHLGNDERLNLERLWRHSIAAAHAAQALGLRARTRMVDPYDAYTCGLLHDLGKLVLFESVRERYCAVIDETGGDGSGTYELERTRFGITHTEVGSLLAREWHLPDEVVESIRLHHGARNELILAPMAALVSLSDELVLAVEAGGAPPLELQDHAASRLMGIEERVLQEVFEHLLEAWHGIVV